MENQETEKEGSEKKSKKPLVWIILIIVFLVIATSRHFQVWQETLKEVRMPKLEIPKFELSPKTEGEKKQWISPDGKLKLQYPADWLDMESNIFEGFIAEDKGKPLFFAQKLEFEKVGQAFLMVEELIIEGDENIEMIIEDMKKDVEEKKGTMETLYLNIEDNSGVFEAMYTSETGLPIHSKEKLILGENKTFIVSFFTFEKDWGDFREEGKEMINTVQFLE